MSPKKDNSVTASMPTALSLSPEAAALKPRAAEQPRVTPPAAMPAEKGGPKGPEPTRYGDWERKGRCSDF
jgi:hypothetical protein